MTQSIPSMFCYHCLYLGPRNVTCNTRRDLPLDCISQYLICQSKTTTSGMTDSKNSEMYRTALNNGWDIQRNKALTNGNVQLTRTP